MTNYDQLMLDLHRTGQHRAADAIEALRKERDEARAYADLLAKNNAGSNYETECFNRGFARRAEPYANLEDEFEQMGWMWANGNGLLKDRDLLSRRLADIADAFGADPEDQRDLCVRARAAGAQIEVLGRLVTELQARARK